MEIFMSLVRLLDQTVKGGAASSNATDNNMMMYHSFPQATQIAATVPSKASVVGSVYWCFRQLR
ncbi:hypothetical protein DEO72_LG2g3406 [Vigna unguiculata]|uniref:Uncharacterized protein n=1 Tax=Vigna unguiculata TaxID=3917 RepID=A0A4D6L3I0_VIGUN|nr:hypothetical protein DEO72_LG2g3406 [Vigna unguiculata]